MTLTLTLILAAVALATAVACGWMGARPPNPLRGPRMMPYRLIMVSAAACLLMLVVHVVNLLGVTTGR
jgi:hypothetical protein